MALTKDEILSVDDRRYELIDVEEWGGQVRLRTLSGKERSHLEVIVRRSENTTRPNSLLEQICALCLCDDDGKRIFTDPEMIQLAEKSAAALQRVAQAAMKLNALTDEEVQEIQGN